MNDPALLNHHHPFYKYVLFLHESGPSLHSCLFHVSTKISLFPQLLSIQPCPKVPGCVRVSVCECVCPFVGGGRECGNREAETPFLLRRRICRRSSSQSFLRPFPGARRLGLASPLSRSSCSPRTERPRWLCTQNRAWFPDCVQMHATRVGSADRSGDRWPPCRVLGALSRARPVHSAGRPAKNPQPRSGLS